jgi:hypothetical protein
MLNHVDISFELLPLCLRGDEYVATEHHIDLIHLIFIVEVGPMMFSSPRLLCHRLLWHLLVI